MLADDTAVTIVHQANTILEQNHVMEETYWLIGSQIMDLEMNTSKTIYVLSIKR